MSMIRTGALALALAVVLLLPAWAQAQPAGQNDGEVKTFAVLPFTYHGPDKYAYLGQGIQSMLISRLTWRDHLHPKDKSAIDSAGIQTPQGKDQAAAAISTLGVDYLIWGSVTVLGEDASLDVQVQGADGSAWPKSATTTVSGMIPELETISHQINDEIFARPVQAEQAKAAAGPAAPKVLNPELVYNDPEAQREAYLNPQFRYEGNRDGQGSWRSQSLQYASVSMCVTDADNDGVNEIFFLNDAGVFVYQYRDGKLDLITQYDVPLRVQMLRLNVLDANRDGLAEIITTGWDGEQPWSTILNLKNGKFTVVQDRIRLFLNVVQTPPDYKPTLVGMERGPSMPLRNSVHEIVKMAEGYTLGPKLSLPPLCNAFNFGYLPDDSGTGYKFLQVDGSDHLKVYDGKRPDDSLYATGEMYAASAVGMEMYAIFPGLGKRSTPDENDQITYYIPNRLLVYQLGADKRWELIVNRNISVAAQFFSRYRNFPYGEVHSMYWDGVGLSLLWKTRRIQGTVVDYIIADADNDGQPELCVCLNTYRGITGFEAGRTILLAYKLDMNAVEPTGVPTNY